MREQLNNGFQNIDDFLRNTLNNHQAELSPNLWGKMKLKLFKNDVSEFVRFKKFQKAFHPQCRSISLQIKIWASYAAAACLTVGIVYGSSYYISNILNNSEAKTKKEIVPAQPQPLHKGINTIKIEKAETSDISNVTSHPYVDNKLFPKKDNSLRLIPNTSVKTNIVIDCTANTNLLKDNITPIVPNNFNSLINYIQKLNPQDKLVTSEKTDQPTNKSENIENNNPPLIKDTQENIIQTPFYQIEIPNVITPNGDGFNDFLVIKNLDKYIDNSLLITDRSGKVIYEKNSYQNDWDAKNILAGTYYYILTYKDKYNGKGEIKGLITILR